MIKLFLDGYGGEYTIGKLTDTEIENLKLLLERFNDELVIGRIELSFSDDREYFHDFDDVYHGWGPTDISKIIDDDDIIEFEFKDAEKIINPINVDESGYYVMSCSYEKGSFSSISIDCDPQDFDIAKLTFVKDDLGDTWLDDSIVVGAYYCGVELELDSDYCSTNSKSFDQALMYYDSDLELFIDGVDKILDEMGTPKYNTIDSFDDDFDNHDGITMHKYLDIVNKKVPIDKAELEEGSMIYLSPMILDLYGKKICEDMWLSDENSIKNAKRLERMHEVPKFVMEKILKDKPEWLI